MDATSRRHLDDPDWLADAYRRASAGTIAAELGVARGTVLAALRRHGVTIRDRGDSRTFQVPPQLRDPDWLATRYQQASANTIAAELGVAPSSVANALHRHGIAVRGPRERQRFRTPERLHDPGWLRAEYSTKSGAQIAAELGVSAPEVYAVMRQLGLPTDGPWVRRDTRRLRPPPKRRLEQLWRQHQTLKAVAVQLGVSHITVVVWLADIGIFLSDTPAISRRQLEQAVAEGLTIDEIRRRHHVADRTVKVELRRFGLVDAHRHRPTPD
jgi:Mn-dependent DtxR family transcriptional regulator